MIQDNTPLEFYPEFGLWVKREDLCCPGGPNFSKTRGVYAHVASRSESVVAVLDTGHSQGGWAVAKACALLHKGCVVFYPRRKSEKDTPVKPQQLAAQELGADLIPLQAGRSAILYHCAKSRLKSTGYMMPNALKLPESVDETALEFQRTPLPPDVQTIIVSASSGTIAAGLLRGLVHSGRQFTLVVHLGYSRPERAVRRYLSVASGVDSSRVVVVDEQYAYADEARLGLLPPWPCNSYYDLKAFRWWQQEGRDKHQQAIFWNIG